MSSKLYDIYNLLHADQTAGGTPKNVVLSPFNIASCLSMLADGTSGTSREELIKFFDFNKPGQGSMSLKSPASDLLTEALGGGEKKSKIADVVKAAHALFVSDKGQIKQTYCDDMKKRYHSLVKTAAFSTQPKQCEKEINDYVEKCTNGLIKDLLSGQIDCDTVCVLLACLYFKGSWAAVFDKANTKPQDFFTVGKKKLSVPTMYQKMKKFHFAHDDKTGVSCIAVPFEEKTGLWFCAESHSSLETTAGHESKPKLTGGDEKKLGELPAKSDISLCMQAIQSHEMSDVHFYMPKFKSVSDAIDLKKPMEKNGCAGIFKPQGHFKEITDDSSVYVSAILHKCFVSVDEEGAEAAAATAVVMKTRCAHAAPKYVYTMRLNSSFHFSIISADQQAALFQGSIVAPEFKE